MITFRSTNELRESKDGDKVIAVINSKSLDRHGTVIDPAGVSLANYMQNPVFLINHDYGMLAGNGAAIRYQDDKLIAEVPDDAWDKEDADIMKWYRKVKSGKMRMTSIGFTYDYEDMEEEERIDAEGNTVKVPVIRKSELLEFSFVTVGSNPDALVLSRMAPDEILEMLKEIKQGQKNMAEKLSRFADRDYITAVVEEYFERYMPKKSETREPEPESRPPKPADRTELIRAEAARIIETIKREQGKR